MVASVFPSEQPDAPSGELGMSISIGAGQGHRSPDTCQVL